MTASLPLSLASCVGSSDRDDRCPEEAEVDTSGLSTEDMGQSVVMRRPGALWSGSSECEEDPELTQAV